MRRDPELIQRALRPAPGGHHPDLDLRRPIYQPTAAYGHFGRTDIDAPWERTDKVDALRTRGGRADWPARVDAVNLGRRVA